MVVKAITKMKTGKAAGPSGIVAEMLKASGDTGAGLVANNANDRVWYLALSYSSLYSKLCLVSSALGPTDDLVISAETEEGLKMKLNKWKTEMEAKGLRVNMGKTKIMVSGVNLQTLKDSGTYPCSVCRKGVGSNSIYCAGCSHWVHKKCSGVIGSLKSNPDYHCGRCKGTARPIDGRPHNEWLLMRVCVCVCVCVLSPCPSSGFGPGSGDQE